MTCVKRGLLRLAIGVVLLAVAGTGLAGCGGEGEFPEPTIDLTPVEPAVAKDLAWLHRPVLKFDSRERWRPQNIEVFLAESPIDDAAHRICSANDAPGCLPIQSADELPSPRANPDDDRSYLDIRGQRQDGKDQLSPDVESCRADLRQFDCGRGDSSAIYYRVLTGGGRYYIDYWWFFRYNNFPDEGILGLEDAPSVIRRAVRCRQATGGGAVCYDHEGDWEGATVVTAVDEPSEVQYAALAAHSGVDRYGRDLLEDQDGRPVIYVGNGTHAAYREACATRCLQTTRFAVRILGVKVVDLRLPEGRHNGLVDWERNGDEACEAGSDCLLPFPTEVASWNEWTGQWGCRDFSDVCMNSPGPRSPSLQERFKNPTCSGRGRERTCDAAPETGEEIPGTPVETGPSRPGRATEADCRRWFPEDVAVLICDPVQVAAGLSDAEAPEWGPVEIEVPGAVASEQDVAGVVQAVGDPLTANTEIAISGSAPPTTQGFVRVMSGGTVYQCTIGGLDPDSDGQTTLRVRDSQPPALIRVGSPSVGSCAAQVAPLPPPD